MCALLESYRDELLGITSYSLLVGFGQVWGFGLGWLLGDLGVALIRCSCYRCEQRRCNLGPDLKLENLHNPGTIPGTIVVIVVSVLAL